MFKHVSKKKMVSIVVGAMFLIALVLWAFAPNGLIFANTKPAPLTMAQEKAIVQVSAAQKDRATLTEKTQESLQEHIKEAEKVSNDSVDKVMDNTVREKLSTALKNAQEWNNKEIDYENLLNVSESYYAIVAVDSKLVDATENVKKSQKEWTKEQERIAEEKAAAEKAAAEAAAIAEAEAAAAAYGYEESVVYDDSGEAYYASDDGNYYDSAGNVMTFGPAYECSWGDPNCGGPQQYVDNYDQSVYNYGHVSILQGHNGQGMEQALGLGVGDSVNINGSSMGGSYTVTGKMTVPPGTNSADIPGGKALQVCDENGNIVLVYIQ